MVGLQDSGISILVSGGGIAGLMFVIEAHRKGHNVRVIERRPRGETFGEAIIITAPGLQTPKKWPGFLEKASKEASVPEATFKKLDGGGLGHFPVLYEYASGLGIPIEYTTTAAEYFEADGQAGITLSDGQKLTADVVVAADGVASKSGSLILGKKESPISSGFVMYRVTFPVGPTLVNPAIAKEFEGYKNRAFLHADGTHAEENWARSTSIDKALEAVEGWEPLEADVAEPSAKRVSSGGRVVQIGDAAHPFLPTSASGGTMAMEDARSLVACLSIAGKSNISLATKVHNHLRFERVSCAQRMRFKNREVYHNTDWDAVAKNPKILGKMVGDWLVNHDPEKYAEENYAKCAEHLVNGAPFKNSNAVPGYTYKPWTVQELLDASERGEPVVDEGDWC